jgi:hypothetical protein
MNQELRRPAGAGQQKGGRMIRRALLLGLVLAVAGAISGCGGQAADEGNSEGGAEQAQAEGGETSGEAGEEAGSEEGSGGELTRVDVSSPVQGSSYVSPLVEIFGDVWIGEHSFVASNTILRASPANRLEIGSETNAQDNIVMRAREHLDHRERDQHSSPRHGPGL